MKSLESAEMVVSQAMDHFRFLLTDEAEGYRTSASPEVQVFNAIPQDGIDLKDLQEGLDKVVSAAGFKQAMQLKWIKCDKSTGSTTVLRLAEFVEDRVQALLQSVADGEDLPKADIDLLKKRRLIRPQSWKTYKLVKGPKFALEKRKPATELTHEMLKTGAWKDLEFKPYNFDALGQLPLGGHLHPLMKVRTQFRKIFTQMGFEEMPSNQYVESSFWNFDALFQPQQHPARDAHDTFFLTNPATSSNFPPDYMERVKTTHESGGYGSRGYEYHWKLAEAEKNVLRTHTTAVSSRMLYKIGQEGFRPVKYFSIDRVYRNEAIDRTHLAEFHQIEGLVCDKGLSLGDLIGTLHQFFTRLGLKQIRFKPAYNPYTEPSMEIFRCDGSLLGVGACCYLATLNSWANGSRLEIPACSVLRCFGPWGCLRMSASLPGA
ncbi:unnamed protein product [Ostreobium quekettii]|uniref:phenylalanine--tRNA ligase n=1 Tax=Ostreobium quekettii TaxID=121088 RepID=A0A8S1J5S5_9CHLO|nr:unnamed protein product [Ostreobium quekettii]